MAGWQAYNPHTGEVESGLYQKPFVVRARSRVSPVSTTTTLACFATLEQAEQWLAKHRSWYKEFDVFTVENWNED